MGIPGFRTRASRTYSINLQVLNALKVTPSIRILGDLPTAELNSEDYVASVSAKIEGFVAAWNETAERRLLAVEVWSRRTHLAIDLNNDQYDYQTAHQHSVILPVYLLQFSSRSRTWKFSRRQRQDAPVAARIAILHHANGQNPLPFLEDHTKIITHYTPRSSTH
ncbi:uncharacterized protein N7515_009480 [Penicillium bovifimosum]|uniref:Uncharacterized protein n=1 Tax=Penicillium bovifimosum TaxID=126998 RepID=A0A9W9GJL5_9EURO|nr:uncharacterized protein N7515_009480 [Penicillium bovifimosum]KAJ5121519.1 hypothetical protein N7515_009480 [Penicillium bovifimosum]